MVRWFWIMNWKDVERNMSQGIYVRAAITTDEVQNTKYNSTKSQDLTSSKTAIWIKTVVHHKGDRTEQVTLKYVWYILRERDRAMLLIHLGNLSLLYFLLYLLYHIMYYCFETFFLVLRPLFSELMAMRRSTGCWTTDYSSGVRQKNILYGRVHWHSLVQALLLTPTSFDDYDLTEQVL